MTTRRSALKLTVGAGLAMLGSTSTAGATSDLEALIACRDQIQRLMPDDEEMGSCARIGAVHFLDVAIMKMCPHYPDSYTVRQGDTYKGSPVITDWVTCPICRATGTRHRYLDQPPEST